MQIRLLFYTFILAFYSHSQHEIIDSVCFNSCGNDYCVRIINDQLYFISDSPDSILTKQKDQRTGHWFTDIYQVNNCYKAEAKLVKNSLGQNVSINSRWYDGPISYSKKDSVIFFSNTSEGFEHGKMGIYWSKELKDGSYTDPQAFPFNSSQYSCLHPFFDERTSLLYFSSDLASDSSNFDIYTVKFENLTFGQIDTLNFLNSKQNDLFPYLHDNKIYLSSNRIGGMGGLDLYCFDEAHIITPLKAPLNSEFDDFGISFITKNKGYLSTNRNKSNDDIYAFYLPNVQEQLIVKSDIDILVNDLETLLQSYEPNSSEALILQAAIDRLKEQEKTINDLSAKLIENQTKLMGFVDTASFLSFEEKIALYQNVIEGTLVTDSNTDNTSNISINDLKTILLKNNSQDILNSINQIAELKESTSTISSKETKFYNEKLIPFTKEQPLDLGHINELVSHYQIKDSVLAKVFDATYPLKFYFDFDHFTLNDEQMNEVKKFISSVSGFGGKIVLVGHTDNIGSAKYNLKLSKQRAEFITKLLIAEGFNPENIKIEAKGESEPEVPNKSDKKGTLLNRRVVVRLIPIK